MSETLAIYIPEPHSGPDSAEVYLGSLAEGGRRQMAARLRDVARIMGRVPSGVEWGKLRARHVTIVKSALEAEGKSPATVNMTIALLRGIARQAWRDGLLTAEQRAQIDDVGLSRGSRLPTGRALSQDELIALFDVCRKDETVFGARDAALFAILVGAGLRRSEAASLNDLQFDAEANMLTVIGKGNKERTVYLAANAVEIIQAWRHMRDAKMMPALVLADALDPLLCPIDWDAHILWRHLHPTTIYPICRRRAEQAGLKRFSPHDLRRTFVCLMLDAGVDMGTVMRQAGHANIKTTQRYDRRGEQAKKKAAETIVLPWR